jgi:hypothetical protein
MDSLLEPGTMRTTGQDNDSSGHSAAAEGAVVEGEQMAGPLPTFNVPDLVVSPGLMVLMVQRRTDHVLGNSSLDSLDPEWGGACRPGYHLYNFLEKTIGLHLAKPALPLVSLAVKGPHNSPPLVARTEPTFAHEVPPTLSLGLTAMSGRV